MIAAMSGSGWYRDSKNRFLVPFGFLGTALASILVVTDLWRNIEAIVMGTVLIPIFALLGTLAGLGIGCWPDHPATITRLILFEQRNALREDHQRGDSQIVFVGRNQNRGQALEKELRNTGSQATFLRADLSTLRGMRSAAAEIRQRVEHLDAIVHSAGGVFSKFRQFTEDGLELAFAIQVLARFVLTEELLDHLKASQAPKVVAIAGGGKYVAKGLDLEDLQGEKSYSRFGSINKTAVANDLLTIGQITHHKEIAFFNYGPGLVRTKVSMPNPVMEWLMITVGRFFSHSPSEAAADIVALLSGDYPSGFYSTGPKLNDPTRLRDQSGLSVKLWDYCAKCMEELKRSSDA